MSYHDKKIDLHMHSTASDGSYTPKQLMEKCFHAGLSVVSLTDHDTTKGIFEAKKWAKYYGMTLIPGIELSTRIHGISVDILGYGIDPNNETLQRQLETFRMLRIDRMKKMVQKCNEHGLHITFEEVKNIVKGDTYSRPHLAEVLVKRGYAATKKEAFERYLASDKPCYVHKDKELTPREAIQLIHKAGGVAIVAHPIFYSLDDEIKQWLIEGSLDGIEVYHREHDEAAIDRFLNIAKEANKERDDEVLVTGGSDFHDEKFGRKGEELGKTILPFQYGEKLLKRLNILS